MTDGFPSFGRRIAALLVMCAILAGCGGAVEVPAPRPDGAAKALCQTLHERLPDKLRGQSQRKTRPDSDLVAAWGKPAIGLRCGVGRPPGMAPTSELALIDGLSWFPEPPSKPVTFTVVGRQAYVEVTVPPKYSPPAEVLSELTGPVKAALPAKPDDEL